ncbi:glycosyltransferase family 4 protein [Desulfogranum marinum]|uniref:glycosyltransferase family 4 protein n=1 Tax=Desulfogranum marinum TaxID=453220 RepID=UPI00196388FC|nr:glycosyltransferase family 4 protein [Desulfogranum marinum]MBM9514819.1 glycosyltransferase family 4 protein [Desulfogranum marinum]
MQTVKILFLMNSLKVGGAERQTIHLLNRLNREKFSVGLVYLAEIEDLKPSLETKNLFHCECFARKGKLDFSVLKKLHQIILDHGVQLVVCVEEYPLLYASLYRLIFRNIPAKIITVIHHNLHLPNPWIQVKKYLYRICINNAEKVIFVCQNQAQYWYQNNGIHKSLSTIIYNGIDPSLFNPARFTLPEKDRLRESLQFSTDDFVVGICARMNPVKRHVDFLKGLALVKKTGVQIKGLLIGDGPERGNIEEAARQLGLLDDVVFTYFQQDVRPYIVICDCIAITSHSEAFSMAALETMAMEKPLVMAISGGADEQVKDGETGFLYTFGEVDKLAKHLIWLEGNRDKTQEMGIKSRTVLLDNFTLQTMTRNYEDQFLQLAN